MSLRWPVRCGVFFGLLTLLHVAALASDVVKGHAAGVKLTAGYLVVPCESGRPDCEPQVVPYLPQPGDIILYDDFSKFHHFCYKLACTEAPMHVSMVIAREDGTPALLELTGPIAITAKVMIMDVEPRLSGYPGTIMVRRSPAVDAGTIARTHQLRRDAGREKIRGVPHLHANHTAVPARRLAPHPVWPHLSQSQSLVLLGDGGGGRHVCLTCSIRTFTRPTPPIRGHGV